MRFMNLGYAGLECTQLDRKEQNWTGWDWIGRAQNSLSTLDRIKLNWSARQRNGLDWTEPESTSEN